MNPTLLVIGILFLAVFTQSLAGFGVALVAMALLPNVVGIQVATPLVALVALTIEIILLLKYRHDLNLKAVWRVAVASLVGIPFGILLLKQADERVVLTILGVIIAGYGLYGLFGVNLPTLKHPGWAWGAGVIAGMFGGAYNTSGPAVIIYGNCRRWPPAEFKSNLQGFFLFSSAFIALGHVLAGTLTTSVWRLFLVSLPVMGLAIIFGVSFDRYLNPERFRKIVLVLLVLMGIRLLF
jgi:uncharacterized membrane protein YfcA